MSEKESSEIDIEANLEKIYHMHDGPNKISSFLNNIFGYLYNRHPEELYGTSHIDGQHLVNQSFCKWRHKYLNEKSQQSSKTQSSIDSNIPPNRDLIKMGEAVPPDGFEKAAVPDGFEERAAVPEVDVHPPTLEQSNPWFLSQVVYYVIAFVTQNGWFCVVLAIACYYLWSRFQPKVQELKARRERDNEAAEYHKDPDKFIAKERAIAAARQRMQDEYNRKSEQHLEDLKLREEQKRQERVEEAAQATIGAGRRLIETNNSASLNTVNKNKDKGKPRLRPEYNPLMGDGSSSSSSGWRPSRRTGGG